MVKYISPRASANVERPAKLSLRSCFLNLVVQTMQPSRQSDSLEFLEKIKKLAITGIFSVDDFLDRLVLKGGNLLDLVYGLVSRSSVDIDLSMEDQFDDIDEELKRHIHKGLTSTFSDEYLVVHDLNVREVPPNISDDMKDFWGGYKIDFKVIGRDDFEVHKDDVDSLRRNSLSIGKNGSTKFTIDISKFEHCAAKEMSDIDGFTVCHYSPRMFVCEKLRAICQQMPCYIELTRSNASARARDFLDIYSVCSKFDIDFVDSSFRELLLKTFAVKRVRLSSIGEIEKTREFHRPDFVSVRDTVKPGVKIESFDFYFDFILELCEKLESFWNE